MGDSLDNMTSLLAVGYETILGYDSHLESSQIWSGPKAWDCFFLIARVLHRLDLGRELKKKLTLSLLIKARAAELKHQRLLFRHWLLLSEGAFSLGRLSQKREKENVKRLRTLVQSEDWDKFFPFSLVLFELSRIAISGTKVVLSLLKS
ncbi:hypothetical protein VNO77_46373 [Canavalia gladiata]|uniref:Uncharacterized protein n=1 Tax=Canavalia gladiata TaxID=3824 RepID=A0AAN9JJG4_CANGL